MVAFSKRLQRVQANTIGSAITFFRAGRSIFVLVCGILILIAGLVVLFASFSSREAEAANPGWDTFVAVSATNQWLSGSFFIAAACIILSINYLPRLEGEA